jgi:hypothetical protein
VGSYRHVGIYSLDLVTFFHRGLRAEALDADAGPGRPLAALSRATGMRAPRLPIPDGGGSITLAVAPDVPSELTVARLANGADLVIALTSAHPSLSGICRRCWRATGQSLVRRSQYRDFGLAISRTKVLRL